MTIVANDRPLSVRDVAAIFGCSVPTVWRKKANKDFPQPFKVAGLTRWSEAEVMGFIEDAKQSREAA